MNQTSTFSYTTIQTLYPRHTSWLYVAIALIFSTTVQAQLDIAWQKSYGTSMTDNAVQVFPDEKGNMIIIGKETHADFTGNFRPYMMTTKLDPAGNEIWKTYHDVAFNLFNPPIDYSIGKHFYTEEWGDTLLNIVIGMNQQAYQYKILDRTGDYYFYELASSAIIDVDRVNEKVYANVLCSIQQSCYGPDSLVVEKFDPTPDSIIFNPIKWTYELKQNFRTPPAQGHCDFDLQDIRMDHEGNTYLLVQIERWDFQFCTDCADAFVDAWSEVFKFDQEGNLLKHVNLQTVHAVVSSMGFVRMGEDEITIQINDINASGTKLLTTLYRIDDDLNVQKKITMNEVYYLVQADEENNLLTARNIFDENNPEIKGLSDVIVSGFNADGGHLWDKYFGGSSWDFPHGLSLSDDGSLYFLANTQSNDFDVTENFGDQDIWLVKLTEGGSTFIPNQPVASTLDVFPNPCYDYFQIDSTEPLKISLFDAQGVEVLQQEVNPSNQIEVKMLPAGVYTLRSMNDAQQEFVARLVKL